MSLELQGAIFALISAACYGSGDFTGGFNSKRNSVFAVVILSQFAGLVLYLALGLLTREALPPVEDLVFTAIGGTIGLTGVLALYQSLATGSMGITAPVAGVITAALPVIFTAITQGLPDVVTLLGFAVGLIAVWLVAQSETTGKIHLRAVMLPAYAGFAFGLAFLFFVRGTEHATFFPLAAARLTTVALLALFIRVTRAPFVIASTGSLALIIFGGLLDAGGNGFFVAAAQIGRIDVAAVLSSMYPAATVTLAAVLLREKIRPIQGIGILLALVAIVLIVG